MFCNKCGHKLNAGDAFCSKCGNDVRSITSGASASDVEEQIVSDESTVKVGSQDVVFTSKLLLGECYSTGSLNYQRKQCGI